ncbi:O-methyltransferase, partial [Thamnocephalis sphaerospora]
SATQGRLLRMLARTMGVRRILELGCFTGQSALWLAEGALLGANRANAGASVQVVTCELDPQAAAMARAWIARAGLADQVQVWEGPAQTTCVQNAGPFDLIFIDANKGGYIQYLDTILSRNLLTEHGLIVADNGRPKGSAPPDVSSGIDSLVTNAKPGVRRAATAMHAFNRYSAADTRIEVILLPLFDGLSLIQRRASL